jgi:predicted DNA-binding WGR domain protein
MTEGSSNKFWEIDLAGRVLTVRFGRIGSAGQMQKKPLASPENARREHDKLVAEKLKKGYREIVATKEPDAPKVVTVTFEKDGKPTEGILADALRLFEKLANKTPARRVVMGKVVFPPGKLATWLKKTLDDEGTTVQAMLDDLAARVARGEHFLEARVDGDLLEIAGWDWLDDTERHLHELTWSLHKAAPLEPKGEVRTFARYGHGDTNWASWKLAGKKIVVREKGDRESFGWEDPRVKAALDEVAPRLAVWMAAHPDVRVRIERSGLWGYIDDGGREVIAPAFAGAEEFHEGLAFVSIGLARTRVIDTHGKFLPGEWQYEHGGFQRGLAAISVDERWGYIDTAGKFRVRPRFQNAAAFTGPLAAVHVGNFADSRQRWITPEGELVGDEFDYTHGFSEDRAWVYPDAKKAWGCVDERGQMVIPCRYADCASFSGSLAAVRESEREKWGYVNRAGGLAVTAKFDEAYPFADKRAIVRLGKQYRIIDARGEFLGKPFDGFLPTIATPKGYVGTFTEGVLGVKIGRKVGYLSTDGKVLVEPTFDEGHAFREGLALVGKRRRRSGKEVLLWGMIDRNGQVAIPLEYENLLPLSGSRAIFCVEDRWGMLDRTGNVVVPPRYKHMQRGFSNGLAWVQMP